MLYPGSSPRISGRDAGFLHALLPPGADRARSSTPSWRGSSARAPDLRSADRRARPSPRGGRLSARGRAAGRARARVLLGRPVSGLAGAARSRSSGPSSPGRRPTLPAAMETVVFRVRGPRVLAALAVGAALAAAGSAYQGLFRNPLVSPDILGVSSGAALGAVLGIYLSLRRGRASRASPSRSGLAAVAAVYAVGASLRRHDPDPGARAGRHRHRHAARLLHLAAQVPGRSLQPAPGHHVLAAGEPRVHHGGGSALDPARRAGRPGPALAPPLAHERDDAQRRGGAQPSAWTRGACGSS